jgi:hypothetical protein
VTKPANTSTPTPIQGEEHPNSPLWARTAETPNVAKVRDFWLGGSHHGPADRRFAEQFTVCAPHLPYLVRTQRAFLGRAVRYFVDSGIRQFLDLGSGLPTMGNVHQVAQRLDRSSRVVYVDVDPVVAEESASLLDGQDNTAYLCADLTDPRAVLDSPEVRRLLDPSEPTGVFLIDVLHMVPDSLQPADMISTYVDTFGPGSHVALSHICRDEGLLAAVAMFQRLFSVPVPQFTFRYPLDVVDLLAGLDIVEPGVVPIPFWRPSRPPEQDQNPENFRTCAAVARREGE